MPLLIPSYVWEHLLDGFYFFLTIFGKSKTVVRYKCVEDLNILAIFHAWFGLCYFYAVGQLGWEMGPLKIVW